MGDDIDLGKLPAQICWPGEPAPLITWPLVITAPPEAVATDQEENVGVYRMQILGRDRAIIRWLAHRGSKKRRDDRQSPRHRGGWINHGINLDRLRADVFEPYQ